MDEEAREALDEAINSILYEINIIKEDIDQIKTFLVID